MTIIATTLVTISQFNQVFPDFSHFFISLTPYGVSYTQQEKTTVSCTTPSKVETSEYGLNK